jgi:septum formation topological specificity factor MinE
MIPHRINAKLFVTDETAVSLTAIVPVFHRWIQTQAVPGLLIDVADYKHVQDGPGVLIIGHDGDYALDQENGRSGLLYTRKREWPTPDFKDRLRLVIGLAVQATQLLANEESLDLDFRTDEIGLAFPDRLNAPNTPETLAALQDDIIAVLSEVYGSDEITLATVSDDEKRPFSVQAAIANAPTLAELNIAQLEPAA